MRFLVNRASPGCIRVRFTSTLFFAAAYTALCTMPVSAAKTLIYKSVDDDGSVEFTDQKAPNAVIVTPSPLNIVDSPASKASQSTPDPTKATVAQTPDSPSSDAQIDLDLITISNVTISSPAHQETLIDHQGPIWIVIETAPAKSIPAGLTAEVTLDGKRVVTGSSDRLPIEVPSRGTHQLQAKIVNSAGELVAESAVHDIHVKQQVTKNTN